MKDVGIVGLPYSGKSTLFTALTRSGAVGGRSNQAVVEVPDERIGILTDMHASKKVVAAKVRFVDVPGGLTAQGIGEFRQTDALAMVVRAFGDDADPVKDLSALEAELIIADLASIESGVEKARKKAKGKGESQDELAVLEKSHALLDAERPLIEGSFDSDELKLLRGYGPLTLKPWIVIANVEEGGELPEGLPEGAIAVSASLEAEVAGVDPDEARELLAGFGVEEPGLERVVGASYRALDLITFLTTGDDETRAWEVRRGAKAPEAAGVIHSDLERGFIRAEVVGYDDLISAGSWDAAKQKGVLRVEGKDYVVVEGDVLNIRFAV
ncbi:MAG: ribosome-binding ATPase [Actinomycetota bacterium]|jgi:GTP-binding protein YchF|nr:ribosome-binding ATPase [Actinomycetota bacterium]